MLDRVVSRSALLERIDALRKDYKLVGPVRRAVPDARPPVRYFYQPVEQAAQIALDFSYCVYAPKPLVLPPRETLLRYDRDRGRFTAEPLLEAQRTALIGVHPCDLHALATLDTAFSQDVADAHYLARRERLFIVGIDCPAPCHEDAFCLDMDANQAETGFDVMLYPLRSVDAGDPSELQPAADCEEYGVIYGTPAGRAWLPAEGPCPVGRPPGPADARGMEAYLARKRASFRPRLRAGRPELAEFLARSWDSLVWEAHARRCYSCGSCNLVCPTCYCFDVRDENDLSGGCAARERCWDACMLHDFAAVAGGHNFRPRPAQRLRHRLFRKAAWIEQRTGGRGCVGCGRCDRACTARISVVEILNQLMEETGP